ncbi:MAG: MFS transporter [Mycoplasmatales bacterium]
MATTSRRLFIILLVIFVSLGLPDSLVTSTWPDTANYLKVDINLIAGLSLIPIFFSMLSANYAAQINRIIAADKIILVSVILCVIAVFSFALYRTMPMFIFSLICFGTAAGAVDTNVNIIASKNLSKGQLNLLHGFWGVGISTTPFIASVFYAFGYTTREVYFFIGFLLVLVFIITYRFKSLFATRNTVEQKQHSTFKMSAKDYLGPLIFYFSGIEIVIGVFLAAYAVTAANLTTAEASFVVFAYWIGFTISCILTSYLFKFFKATNIIKTYMICLLLISGFVLTKDFYLMSIVFFVIGFCFGPIYPTIINFTSSVYQEHADIVISKQVSFFYMSMFINQIIFGYLFEKFSLNLFSVLIIIDVIGLVIVVLLYLRKHRNILN